MSIEIHPSAFKAMQGFPPEVLIEAKEAFGFLEAGEKLSMPLSKPMPSIWSGCHELRIGSKQGTFRIFYVFVVRGIIFVPHCFKKKAQKTPRNELVVAQRRIKEFLNGS